MLDFVSRRAGPFTGEGQNWFPFGFLIFSPDDVKVTLASSADDVNPQTLVYGADYTVVVNEDQQATPGGSVSLTVPLKAGEVVALISGLKYTQETQLTNYSRFPPEVINDALDRTVILIQQLVEQAERALCVPPTSTESPQVVIEKILEAAAKANEYVQMALEVLRSVQQSEQNVNENKELVLEAKASVDESKARVEELSEVVEENKDNLVLFKENVEDFRIVVENKDAIQAISADLQGFPIDEFDGGWTDEADQPMTAVGGVIRDCAENIAAIKSVADALEGVMNLEDMEAELTEIGSTDYVTIDQTGISGAR